MQKNTRALTARSEEEYHLIWQESVSRLRSSPVAEFEASQGLENEDSNPLPYAQIGPYYARPYRHGLFSTIFCTHCSVAREQLALKLTLPSQMSPPHDSRREARLLRKAAHPSVVPFLDGFQQPGGGLVLVFPFFPLTLKEALSFPETLPVLSILSCLHHLCSALAHIHSIGIIHRDVKPSNILLASPSGPAYLADFGIAWMEEDETSEPAHAKITDVGTAAYRPPELLFGYRQYGCELDLWAMGCVVAECFSETNSQLFDPGPLGSELGLIQSIFKTLGTPTSKIWPVSYDVISPICTEILVVRESTNSQIGARWHSSSTPPNLGSKYFPLRHKTSEA